MLGREDLAHQCTIVSESICQSLSAADSVSLRRIRNPVLWACTNPVATHDLMIQAQHMWGPGNFFVMDWDAHGSCRSNCAYWPCFFLEQVSNTRLSIPQRQHRISMLSGRVRPHRLDLWRHVRDLIRSDDVIVINSFGRHHCGFDHANLPDLPWANHPEFLDQLQTQEVTHNTMSTSHTAFRACVNITAETLGQQSGLFVTEKTWKSLMAGCMPWHWGCQGVGEYLSELGFQDWFGPQADAMTSALELFSRDDIYDFYNANQERIQQDLELLWSSTLRRSLTAPAIQGLESWLAR